MPKASREKPRVLIDDDIGWTVETLSFTHDDQQLTIIDQENISPDYDWSKLMPPTKLKPQFRVWVYPMREYLVGTEWEAILYAAEDHCFEIRLKKEIVLDEGVAVPMWYIFAAPGTDYPEDPYVFPKFFTFCELLATTNVPPSVAIQILYGQLGHRYLPIGCQLGGLAGSMTSPRTHFSNAMSVSLTVPRILSIPGVTLYLTGNTISVVGKLELDLQLEMVVNFAKRCIVLDQDPEDPCLCLVL